MEFLPEKEYSDSLRGSRIETYCGVLVDLQACCTRVKSRYLRHVVIFSLALLLLELERNTTDGPALNTLHQVGGEAGDLVPEALGGNHSLYERDEIASVSWVEGY